MKKIANTQNMNKKNLVIEGEGQKISEESFQIILSEYNTQKDLYLHSQESIQGIFNFYIALVSAVFGGLVFVLQFPSAYQFRAVFIAFFVLLLFAIIGSFYLLSIAGRYANLIRYGKNLDELRLHLVEIFGTPMPSSYGKFLSKNYPVTSVFYTKKPLKWFAWLLPVGTYHFAMAFINSLCITLATSLTLFMAGTTSIRVGNNLLVLFIEFFVLISIYNLYSRISIRRWVKDLNAHTNIHFDHSFRMIR